MPEAGEKSRGRRWWLWFIAGLVIFVLYAYSIDVTAINFEEPQDPDRQAVATRVVRALARPDFFVVQEETRTMNINITMPCGDEISGSSFSLSDGRTATLSPNCASTTQEVLTLVGTGFRPRTDGVVRWHPPGDVATTRALAAFRTDGEGSFAVEMTMPDIRPSEEPQVIEIEEQWPSGGFLGTGVVGLSEASKITLEKMVETVLLALMATTMGTILAVPISFLAARNLMEHVGLPLASVMTAVLGLVLGYGIGAFVTRFLLDIAATLTNNTFVGLGLAVGLLALAVVVVKVGPSKLSTEEQSRLSQSIGWVRFMLLVVILFFAIALLAYMGMVLGDWVTPQLGIFAFMGRFIRFLSEGITILAPAITGFLLALVGASLGSTYGQEAILRVEEAPGRIITGITAMLGTAVSLYLIGSFCNWLWQFDNPVYWTTYPAVIGGVVMLVVGLLIPPRRQFPVGFTLYSIFRFILNMIRSIEPLIYVIVFAVWVGIGAFAGVLALTIHTIASLGKLFSEQVESIAEGPVEAITATGASRLQMILFAVVPQVVPPFIAFTLYRWDINVRFSTVLGFAGGGGIGFVLVQSINLLQYRQAAVMMIGIALVVWILDYASSEIRNRVI
jgi:phosphonate ABC transporter permease subunit PhnE